MLGGRFFENIWDPYSVAYAYPRPRYNRPRAAHYEVPEDRSNEQPLNEETVKTVKTIPVTDGGAPDLKPVAKSEDAAATEIQAFYRGYVVRKTQPLQHLKLIKKVNGELESLKFKSQEAEQKMKLRSDSKERLRWTEGVMALLLRLDSLQGVHPEVRLIRKAVTKELIGFQETIDSMSSVRAESNNVISHETISSSAAEVVEEIEIEDNVSRGEEQDFASGGASENGSDGLGVKSNEVLTSEKHVPHAPLASNDHVNDSVAPQCDENGLLASESMVGVGGPSASETHPEDPMDAKNKEQLLMTSPAYHMDEGEIEPASGGASEKSSDGLGVKSNEDLTSEKHVPHAPLASNDHVIDSVAPQCDENGLLASESMVEVGGPSASETHPEGPVDAKNKEQLLMTSPAHHMEEGEIEPASAQSLPPEIGTQDAEVDMSQSGVHGGNPTLLEEKETTGLDGRIVPARISTQSMALESQCEQEDKQDNIYALSDRSLLLQVLEENRKLRDVLGKVLEWGKQQSDVIQNLTHRIAQLEEHQPPSKLLHGKDRKRVRPVDNMERSRRRLGKGRRNRRDRGYVDSEDWPSVESDDYF